jgi:hypothetical protein
MQKYKKKLQESADLRQQLKVITALEYCRQANSHNAGY